MKSVSHLSFTLLILLFSCQPKSTELLQREIDGVTKRWVPDKRIGICNFTVSKGENGKMILSGETIYPEAKAEALQLLYNKNVGIADSVVILPDSTKSDMTWGVITLSIANLRSQPAHSSELVSQAILGTPVRVLKENDGWVLIQTPDQYIAWTNESAVQQMTRSAISDWRNANRIIYSNASGTVFEDKNQTIVLSDLVAGAIVIKKAEDQNNFEISLPDGRSGYVSRQHWLNFKQWKDTISLIPDNLIFTGKQLMGFPYLWGGTSSKAMDCSGFVKTVCFLNGVILERDASQQVRHGKEIDISRGWENLQKGDLLFFGSKQPFRIVHVGMYIGNGEVINSSGRIRINSIDKKQDNYSNYLGSTFVAARRIIGFAPEQGYWLIRNHNWY